MILALIWLLFLKLSCDIKSMEVKMHTAQNFVKTFAMIAAIMFYCVLNYHGLPPLPVPGL